MTIAMKRVVALLFVLATVACAQTVRVGVFGLFRPDELCVGAGSGVAVLSAGADRIVLEKAAGPCAARVRASGSRLTLRTNERILTFTRLTLAARDGGAVRVRLAVPGKISREFGGVLNLTSEHGVLVPVVEMDVETAVASVVAAEASGVREVEALKAQAVAARSFLVAARGQHRGFDFCDTTHCQFLREPPSANHPAAIATAATRGLVLTWEGSVIAALYSAACGGETRSLQQIGMPAYGYPYFAVTCDVCRRSSPQWRAQLQSGESVETERERLAIGRERGWSAVPGNNFRKEGELLVGHGSGHGVGLCQQGAAGMAWNGKSFREILAHYYPNTVVRPLLESDHQQRFEAQR